MDILVARRSFITKLKGERFPVHVYKGDHAHADHPVVNALPDAFRPLEIKWATKQEKESQATKKTLKQGKPVP